MWFELKPVIDRIESEAAAARSAEEEALRRTKAENKRAAQRKAESEIVAAIEGREAEKLRKLMQSYDDTSASQQHKSNVCHHCLPSCAPSNLISG